jgi:type I restriction enzyme S subunit
MSDQQRVSLSDICFLRNGAGIKQECFGNDGAKIVRVSDFTDTSIDTSSSIRIDRKYENRWREYFLNEGDILVATVGSWSTSATSAVGKVVTVPPQATNGIQNQNTCAIIAKSDVADQRYIYYALRQEDFRGFVAGAAAGSANQARLSIKNLASYLVSIYSLTEQKAIAHILGTLDDKIELNRKTNETLEAMAKALFKSWFVDFDPVRAKAERRPTGLPAEISNLFPDSFEDSELGEIPCGWEMETLGEILDVDKGVSYKGDFLSDTEGLPMVNLGCFAGGGAFRAEKMKFYAGEYRERHLASAGDLLVANTDITQNRVILGAPIIVPPWRGMDEFLFSHHTFAIRFRRSKSAFTRFIYFTLLKPSFRQVAAGHATGTTVLALPKDGITDYLTVIPPAGLLNVFAAKVEALYQKGQAFTEQSELLAKTRDALLPKLISGELRIPDAEKMLEEVGI